MIGAMAKFFVQGGNFMWVILIVFAAALAVVLERLFFYVVVCRDNARRIAAELARSLEKNDLDGARKACAGKSPVHILLSAVLKLYEAGLNHKEIRQGVEEAAIQEMPRYAERLNYLSLFANIATLLGLMGTIFGLIMSFGSISTAEAAQKATLLATGISVAMNTTAFGLIVAVPCMIAHTMLGNKQAALSTDLDEALVKVLHFMEKKRP